MRRVLIVHAVLAMVLLGIVVQAQSPAPPSTQAAPTVAPMDRLQLQNAALRRENAQLRAQQAQVDYAAAQQDLEKLWQGLQRDGYDLDSQTLTYTKKPATPPKAK